MRQHRSEYSVLFDGNALAFYRGMDGLAMALLCRNRLLARAWQNCNNWQAPPPL